MTHPVPDQPPVVGFGPDGCPKTMTHGPCGGARLDGGCEVPGVRCPFLAASGPVGWSGERVPAVEVEALPAVIVDFRPDPGDTEQLDRAATALLAAGTGVLIGEHVDDPTSHTPATVARAVLARGLPVISTITCRGRELDDLGRELDAVAALGPLAIHCVTGDHPAARSGLDVQSRFGADSLDLSALAAGRGLAVSVAESPGAAPAAWRPERLLAKQRAGASLAILNHGGLPAEMVDFADRCRQQGASLPLVAPVPVITDHRSARSLRDFPGLHLPSGLIERILASSDPPATGAAVAIELAGELLASGRFAAVNLSGSGAGGDLATRAGIMADIARAVVAVAGDPGRLPTSGRVGP